VEKVDEVAEVEKVAEVASVAEAAHDRAAPAAPRRAAELLHPPRRTQRWLWPLAVLTVAGVAFGAVASIERAHRDSVAADQQRAEDAAASAASTAAERILGYSYTSVAADLAAAQKQMTPAFAKKFAKVEPTVESLAKQRKLVVKASVRNAAVLECGDDCSADEARVLLYVDQARTGDGKALDAIAVRTVFTMTKTGGRWLVSDSVSL
jgi:hypothetical protein